MSQLNPGHQIGRAWKLKGSHRNNHSKVDWRKRRRAGKAHLLLTLLIFNLGLLILGRLCEASGEAIGVRCFLLSLAIWIGWLAGRKDLRRETNGRLGAIHYFSGQWRASDAKQQEGRRIRPVNLRAGDQGKERATNMGSERPAGHETNIDVKSE